MGHFVDGGPGRPEEQRRHEQGHRHGQGAGREGRPAGKGRVHLAGVIDVIRHQPVQGGIQGREQLLARHGSGTGRRRLAEILAQAFCHAGGRTLFVLGIPDENQAEHLPDACGPRAFPVRPVRCGSLRGQSREYIFRWPRAGAFAGLRRGIRLMGVHPSPPSRQMLPRKPPCPLPGQASGLRRRCRADASKWHRAVRTSSTCRSP